MNVGKVFKRFCPGQPHWTDKDCPDLHGRVYVVTGASSGIGFQISRLLSLRGARVWMVSRSRTKILCSQERILEENPDAKLEYFTVDLLDLNTVRPGVSSFLEKETRLDGVIHNAAVMTPPQGSRTLQGYELQLGVNCIGPWLLQKYLDDLLIKTAESAPVHSVRIVWVSSYAHEYAPEGGLNWDDRHYNKTNANKIVIYGQSKAVNIQQAILWKYIHPEAKVISLSCNPGLCNTQLYRHMPGIEKLAMRMLLYEPVYGAYTELFALIHPQFTDEDNGSYVHPFEKIWPVRKDIVDSVENEKCKKLEFFLDSSVEQYM